MSIKTKKASRFAHHKKELQRHRKAPIVWKAALDSLFLIIVAPP